MAKPPDDAGGGSTNMQDPRAPAALNASDRHNQVHVPPVDAIAIDIENLPGRVVCASVNGRCRKQHGFTPTRTESRPTLLEPAYCACPCVLAVGVELVIVLVLVFPIVVVAVP